MHVVGKTPLLRICDWESITNNVRFLSDEVREIHGPALESEIVDIMDSDCLEVLCQVEGRWLIIKSIMDIVLSICAVFKPFQNPSRGHPVQFSMNKRFVPDFCFPIGSYRASLACGGSSSVASATRAASPCKHMD